MLSTVFGTASGSTPAVRCGDLCLETDVCGVSSTARYEKSYDPQMWSDGATQWSTRQAVKAGTLAATAHHADPREQMRKATRKIDFEPIRSLR